MNTEQIAKRLVELCREGKDEQAQDELYADDAVSIEMEGSTADCGNAQGARRDSGKGPPVQRDGRGRAWRQRQRADRRRQLVCGRR